MLERRDHQMLDWVALDWVAKEVTTILDQAAGALAAYQTEPADLTQLRFCLSHVHSVGGTLRIVGLTGGALWADEMEAVLQALLAGQLSGARDEALAALSQSLAGLPAHLERLRRERRDHPAALLAPLNELRAVRNAVLVTESVVFNPRLPKPPAQVPVPPADLQPLAAKLRQMYQLALLNYLKGADPRENLNYLAKVFARLGKLTAGTASGALWDVSIALCEGLLNRSINRGSAVALLLRQIDGHLKGLAEQGAAAFAQAPPATLVGNLLYYVGTSQADSRFISDVRERYALAEALPESSDGAPGTGRSAIDAALGEQLHAVAHRLRQGEHDRRLLAEVRRTRDGAALLGCAAIEGHLHTLLRQWQDGDGDHRYRIAAELVTAADELSGAQQTAAPPPKAPFNDNAEAQQQLDSAFVAVLHESRNGLEQAKEAIIEFVATQWRHHCLEEVPALLQSVRGSLMLAGLGRGAKVLAACENYIRDDLLATGRVPAWQLLDTLADAIASIDYYLERLIDDPEADCDSILTVAEESVSRLRNALETTAEVIPFPAATAGDSDEPRFGDDAGHSSAPLNDDAPPTPPAEALAVAALSSQSAAEVGSAAEDALNPSATEGGPDETAQQTVDTPELSAGAGSADLPAAGADETPMLAESEAPSEPDEELLDPEIAEIFIEEAGEVLETITEQLPVWRADPGDRETLTVIRRAFHTLKGSGRMVGATDIGELAWAVESMLNRILDGTVQADAAPVALVAAAAELAPAMVTSFAAGQRFAMAPANALIEQATLLARPQPPSSAVDEAAQWLEEAERAAAPASAPPLSGQSEELINLEPPRVDTAAAPVDVAPELTAETLASEAPLPQEMTFDDVVLPDLGADTATEPFPLELFAAAPAADDALAQAIVDSEDVDAMLLDIFAHEATSHLEVLEQFIAAARVAPAPLELSDDLQRALHTLKGSAHMAGVTPIAQVATPLEQLVKELRAAQVAADEPIVELLARGLALVREGLTRVEDVTPLRDSTTFNAEIERLLAERLGSGADASGDEQVSSAALGRFLTEAGRALAAVEADLEQWQQGLLDADRRPALAALMSQVVEQADAVNLAPVAELGQALQALLRQAAAHEPQLAFFVLADQGVQQTIDMLDRVAGHQEPLLDAELLSRLQEFAFEDADLPAAAPLPEPATAERVSTAFSAAQPATAQSAEDDAIDAEILEIFLEEAADLLEGIDGAVHDWSADRENGLYLDDLQRILHTLKGGARLAGLAQLGNVAHRFETRLMDVQEHDRAVDDVFLGEVQGFQDELVKRVEAIRKVGHSADAAAPADEFADREQSAEAAGMAAADEPAEPTELASGVWSPPLRRDAERARRSADIVPFVPQRPVVPAVVPARELVDPGDAGMAQQLKRGPQEVVKISAQLLEQLVNLAGETSIARSRTEEQVNEFVHNLDEMQITVERLQEQVRRLDLETEAQVLFRQEQVEIEGLEGFDPLEFDRYSLLQQLSRSLLESASDLIDLKSTLADKARDMETLLVQQSRINTELQEGLMRSRMVPFARMVPRLRRIVRQVAGELGKEVEFHVDNAEGEMDRTVLERIVAPLEHMVRNAIDHGIEDRIERVASGKPARGVVLLSLSREGGEVVLTLSDDGRGIDLAAVRAKAIDRGLMVAGANLSDHEILQFILQAGFSTAQQVTLISGRGVGMDVVYSEIKQLGGTLEIDSEPGQGTRFTVRLPFTVSVNRALMVNVAGDTYAIPLNTIEGIVRVSPFELEAYYQPDAPLFEYAGQPYRMRYMGALIHTVEKPNLEGQTAPLPVLLVRSTEHAVAVQVDGLMGSREIVVKTLGPQFAQVHGLSGATVLGDGSVVVILDLLATIRADASQLHRLLPSAGPETSADRTRPRLVMVVDDSVTVRKVTSRFLEREGMEVMLAKDGIDAINVLTESERVPDVMLLDIEMPRMDGFEVASRIRHTSRLQELPIIMITSRTGEKHRERAFALGVNKYLGKPYQESVLLEAIQELTGALEQV